jgi:hypothetical protein
MTLSITIKECETQHNGTQNCHAEYHYAKCYLSLLAFMLIVPNKPIILAIIMIRVVMLYAVKLSVMTPITLHLPELVLLQVYINFLFSVSHRDTNKFKIYSKFWVILKRKKTYWITKSYLNLIQLLIL